MWHNAGHASGVLRQLKYTVDGIAKRCAVGSRHRRYLRFPASCRKALPHTKRCPHGHRRHLDPLVHDHQAPEHAVRSVPPIPAVDNIFYVQMANLVVSPPSTSSWDALVLSRSPVSSCTVVAWRGRVWRLRSRWRVRLRTRLRQLLLRLRVLLRSLLRFGLLRCIIE